MKELDKLKPISKTIDGHVVEVAPMPARQALFLGFRIIKELGQPIVELLKGPIAELLPRAAQLLKGGNKVGALAEMLSDESDILKTLDSNLFSSIDPDSLTDLMMILCGTARVDNQELTESVINVSYVGNLGFLYRVAWMVIGVNYHNFLPRGVTTA